MGSFQISQTGSLQRAGAKGPGEKGQMWPESFAPTLTGKACSKEWDFILRTSGSLDGLKVGLTSAELQMPLRVL